jgi:hypothetical protein
MRMSELPGGLAQQMMREAVAIGDRGRPLKGEKPDNVRINYGNRAAYLAARLKRGAPAIAADRALASC